MPSKRALAILALSAVMLAACAGAPERSAEVTLGSAGGPASKLQAGDNVFSPEELEVGEGETVSVEVTNKGRIPHDFTIQELDLSTGVLQPGDVATATFTVPSGGDIRFECTLHRGMEGELLTRAQ